MSQSRYVAEPVAYDLQGEPLGLDDLRRLLAHHTVGQQHEAERVIAQWRQRAFALFTLNGSSADMLALADLCDAERSRMADEDVQHQVPASARSAHYTIATALADLAKLLRAAAPLYAQFGRV